MERALTIIKGYVLSTLQVVLGHSHQGSLVPRFIVVNAGSGQLKEPQENGAGQLVLGLVISNQEKHVQVSTYLPIEPMDRNAAGFFFLTHLPIRPSYSPEPSALVF